MTETRDSALRTRRLRPGDGDIARRLFALMAEVFGEPAEPMRDAYLEELLARESFWAFTALDGGELVGGLTAHVLPMTRGELAELFIYDIAVREDRQRQGAGRLLMRAAREGARAAGISELFVPAETADEHALEFYRALGGVPTAVTLFSFDGAVTSRTRETT